MIICLNNRTIDTDDIFNITAVSEYAPYNRHGFVARGTGCYQFSIEFKKVADPFTVYGKNFRSVSPNGTEVLASEEEKSVLKLQLDVMRSQIINMWNDNKPIPVFNTSL